MGPAFCLSRSDEYQTFPLEDELGSSRSLSSSPCTNTRLAAPAAARGGEGCCASPPRQQVPALCKPRGMGTGLAPRSPSVPVTCGRHKGPERRI